MALRNYLVDGSYTVLSIQNYDKRSKEIGICVHIYTDETKTEKISDYLMEIKDYREVHMTVLSHPTQLNGNLLKKHGLYMSTVPDQGTPFDAIYKKPAQWVPDMQAFGWVDEEFMTTKKGISYYDTVSGNWYVDAGDNYVTLDKNYIPNAWDVFFELDQQELVDTNIIYRAYEYAKRLPAFSNTEDV